MEWEGAEFHLEPPPVRESEVPDTAVTDTTAPPPPPLPEHPVLFMGTRRGARAEMVPIAELGPDGPVPLLTEAEAPGFNAHWLETRFPPGSELILFADGSRVGTLVVDGGAEAPDWCEERSALTGVTELPPTGTPPTRLLAIAGLSEPRLVHGRTRDADLTAERRRLGLSLANRAIATVEAPWPPSVSGALRDLQVFHLHPDSSPAIAGSFAYQDSLEVGEPEGPNAYGIFFIAEGGPTDYDLTHLRYRRAAAGKAMARYFQHADWDGDGDPEIVVEVFGVEGRGARLLERGSDGWEEDFELSCGPAGDG